MSSGLVLVDKPKDWTSHDVVAKMRGVLGTRKVGHAGTLDPMATGLLILGVNQGTKLLQYLLGSNKSYTATIRLGQATVSDDAESEVLEQKDASNISEEQIDSEIQKLTGTFDQVPSSVSAKKVDGARAYDLVRAGKDVQLKAKTITIDTFSRTNQVRYHDGLADFDVEVSCSTGTYIRALARDIGIALGVGGHLIALRRTSIADFSVESASEMTAEPVLIDLKDAASRLFESCEILEQQETDLRHGKQIQLDSKSAVVALTRNDQLVALAEPAGDFFKSMAVFQVDQ
ncbi:MAG: tRNA pseudouridine(55) synthase TruB [Aquiluna sp.]|nr:tRNA pseudouridine(55) synthase TruB [Aquiluna sp.]